MEVLERFTIFFCVRVNLELVRKFGDFIFILFICHLFYLIKKLRKEFRFNDEIVSSNWEKVEVLKSYIFDC